MKNKKIVLIVGAIVLLGAIFIGAMSLYKNQETERLTQVADAEFKKFVPDYAPKMGPSNAEVHLVEFLDPECESCREFYPYVKMIMKDYEGRVQLVVRYAPFHGNSRFVIKILEAAKKQGKYWETLELLFQHQPEWGSHHHPQPELIWNYLPQAGVDVEKIKTDMNDPEIETMIAKEISDGEALGVRGTPTFFVNGKPLEEFSYNALRTLVESSLKN
jgi:protein-disulfide isomerase